MDRLQKVNEINQRNKLSEAIKAQHKTVMEHVVESQFDQIHLKFRGVTKRLNTFIYSDAVSHTHTVHTQQPSARSYS